MIRAVCVLLSFFLLGAAEAQEQIKLSAGNRIELDVPGAIMAFSRHSLHARVLAEDGSVFIAARRPGATQIVVLTPTRVITFDLIVTGGPALQESQLGPPSAPEHSAPMQSDVAENITASTPSETVSVESEKAALKEVSVQPVTGFAMNVAELQAGRGLQISIPGATAALAVDPELIDASAENGIVHLTGRAPGRAQVLILTPTGLETVSILVSPAPPSYPPGFVPPVSSETADETGGYELRFSSDRRQIQDRLDFTIRKPGLTTQFHFVNVDFLEGLTDQGRTSLPSGFYRLTAPTWNLTLMDETVTNSPLTIDGVIVRGIHFGAAGWTIHAGYSSLATFADFLIPTQREGAFGISHAFKLSPNSELIQNYYYFPTPPQAFTAGHPGGLGSLLYKLHRPQGLQLLGEFGFSHGFAGAGQIQWTGAKDYLQASFRQKPPAFPSLSIGNLPGSVSEFSWNRKIAPELTSNTNFSESHLILPTGQQTNLTGTANLQYKVSKRWSISTGASYADFTQSFSGVRSSVHSFNLPEQINFDTLHFGAGFQYQFSRISGSLSPGQDLRATLRLTRGTFQLTGFAERQTDALTIDELYSQIPLLQIELQHLGITAITPAQLMALLQDNAFLLSLGYAQQTTLNLLPVRIQAGASLNWTSHGTKPQRLTLDFLRSHDDLLQGSANNWIQSGTYSKSLGKSNEIFGSFSWFHYSALGQSQFSPQAEIGLRHTFSSLPAFLNPGGHGTLSGIIFEDSERRGVRDPQMRPLAGVEVVLDGWQRVESDNLGHYVFTHVPEGTHTIEAKFRSTLPFWFTTPSVVSTTINAFNDFGITFAASELVGYVKNDAAAGIPAVEIEIKGPNQNFRAHSDASGRFAVSGLEPGEYQLAVDPDTVPTGYVLDQLVPIEVLLAKGIPQNVDFRIRAMRTLTGTVALYNSESGQYDPLPDAHVEIRQLSLKAITDEDGTFSLRDLPPGNYEMKVTGNNLSEIRELSIPPEPAELKETFRMTPAAATEKK